jgi:hypothetical protein
MYSWLVSVLEDNVSCLYRMLFIGQILNLTKLFILGQREYVIKILGLTEVGVDGLVYL